MFCMFCVYAIVYVYDVWYMYCHLYTNTLHILTHFIVYTNTLYTHANTLYSIHTIYPIQIKQSSEGGGKERIVWSAEMYPHHLMPIITPGIL